ncbi:hypothetical protein ACMYYO_01870 [Dermacoccaceae bacterium W4C1]
MNDDLERRLRDALAARANQVHDTDLDRDRETSLPSLAAASTTDRSPARTWLLVGGGVAAATALVATLAFGMRDDRARTLADPPAPQSTSAAAGVEPTSAQATPSSKASGTSIPTVTPTPTSAPRQSDRTTAAAPTSTPAAAQPSTAASPATTDTAPATSAAPSSSEASSAAPQERMASSSSGSTLLSQTQEPVGPLTAGAPATPAPIASASPQFAVSGRQVTPDVTLTGQTGQANSGEAVLRTTIDYGDGSTRLLQAAQTCVGGSNASSSTTVAGRPYTYAAPGQYRVKVTVTYCSISGGTAQASAADTVVVP